MTYVMPKPKCSHALPISVSNLISGRTIESSRIEYKREWNPEKVLHRICAFANDYENIGGGT